MSARPFARAVLVIDVLAHAGAIAWAVSADVRERLTTGWIFALVLIAGLTVVAAVGSMGLRARARVWRARLCVAALVVAVWRGGPLDGSRIAILAVVLWTGLVWITLLVEGRRISAAVAEATGEEGLGDDPSRHL